MVPPLSTFHITGTFLYQPKVYHPTYSSTVGYPPKKNWLPTKKRVEQCICANVFKFFNQMSPQYTAEIFHPSSSVHNTRRATQKLDIPFRKSCIGQKTLSYIGPKIWNNLPAQIKLSKSVNTFKHDIKKSFFDDLQKQNDDIFFYY